MKNYNLEEKDIIRFLSKITYTKDCWIPSLKKRKDGYTVFTVKKAMEYLGHRLSYHIFSGPLVDGMVIDHICRNKSCCNPDHLRQVSQEINAIENTTSFIAAQREKTHCNNGHELFGGNLRIEKRSLGRPGVSRRCITCANEKQRNRKRLRSNQESPEAT